MKKIKSILRLGIIENKHILVFGAGGQLGKEFQYLYEVEKFPGKYTFLIREQVDITNQNLVTQAIQTYKPNIVINCAAYTAVDQAESEPEVAHSINALAPEYMALAARSIGSDFFHFSTDYVYDGNQSTPLSEDSPTNPSGVYGTTKLEGEKRVLETYTTSFIIRTAWVYSMFGSNFVRTMLRLGKERDHVKIVNDQIGSPTWARDLARAVLTIIDGEDNLRPKAGIYNYSNMGQCSWHEFGLNIFKIAGLKLRVDAIPTSEFPTPAERPAFSLLDKSKIIDIFGIEIPHWEVSLKKCLEEMLEH